MKKSTPCLIAAALSLSLSVGLWFLGDPSVSKDQAIFVGLWVPSLLVLGKYFDE